MRTAISQVLPGSPNLHFPQDTSTTCTGLSAAGKFFFASDVWHIAVNENRQQTKKVNNDFMKWYFSEMKLLIKQQKKSILVSTQYLLRHNTKVEREETWSTTCSRISTQECYSKTAAIKLPQTMFLKKTVTGWMISSIVHKNSETSKTIPCNNSTN